MEPSHNFYFKDFFNKKFHVSLVKFQVLLRKRESATCKKGVLTNFANFTGKHLCWSFFIKKRLQYRYFPVKFAKFIKTPILNNICERLFLKRSLIILIYNSQSPYINMVNALVFTLTKKHPNHFSLNILKLTFSLPFLHNLRFRSMLIIYLYPEQFFLVHTSEIPIKIFNLIKFSVPRNKVKSIWIHSHTIVMKVQRKTFCRPPTYINYFQF